MDKKKAFEEYFSHIMKNTRLVRELLDTTPLDIIIKRNDISNQIKAKKIIDMYYQYIDTNSGIFSNKNSLRGYDTIYGNLVDTALHFAFESFFVENIDFFPKRYKDKILCKSVLIGDSSAITKKIRNTNDYLILIDSGLINLILEASKLCNLLVSEAGKVHTNNYIENHKVSIHFYAETGAFYSIARPSGEYSLLSDMPTNFGLTYALKFIIGHEISHIVYGDLEEKSEDQSQNNIKEIRADATSISYIVESLASLDFLDERIYKNVLIYPFLILIVYLKISEIQKDIELSTLISVRINTLLYFYKNNVKDHKYIMGIVEVLLEKYEVMKFHRDYFSILNALW